jgi:hypothetical protein
MHSTAMLTLAALYVALTCCVGCRQLSQVVNPDTKLLQTDFAAFPPRTWPSEWLKNPLPSDVGDPSDPANQQFIRTVREVPLRGNSLLNMSSTSASSLRGTYSLSAGEAASLLQKVNSTVVRYCDL